MRAFGYITFPIFLIACMFVALVVQHFLPPIPGVGARVLLMPLIMFYGAVALPTWGMLILAFLGGLGWDLLHPQIDGDKIVLVTGWSIVLYAILSGLMSGFRPWYLRGRWEVHCIVCGLCTAVIPLVEYILLSLTRQPVAFQFNSAIWWRIGGAGLAAMFLAPFFFFTLNYLGYLLGYDPTPSPEEES